MATKEFVDYVKKKVLEYLPYKDRELFPVVMGIIETESDFNPYAARYEPNFRWLVSPERYYRKYSSSPETEVVLQKTSLGLMQVMGANYRTMGYTGPLTALFEDVDSQLKYGIRFFLNLYEKYGNVEDAVAAYNAGSPRKKNGRYVNQAYVDRVLKNAEKWR